MWSSTLWEERAPGQSLLTLTHWEAILPVQDLVLALSLLPFLSYKLVLRINVIYL